VARTYRTLSPSKFRLLLDQGFPKPPGFDVHDLDKTVEVTHLSDFAPHLAELSTPDWALYCFAAQAGFDAIVARDRQQVDQMAEMWVLTRLKGFLLITFRKGTDDPVREWGQLLAYLPDIKRAANQRKPKVILLPSPTLQSSNLVIPNRPLAKLASQAGISQAQARRETLGEISDWLEMAGYEDRYFSEILNLR
jgi:hypothetical protein